YGDGGLVTTNNDQLAYTLRIKRVHGGEQKYYHKVIGGNFRIDALQAAVLRVKLPHLDKWSEKRRANAEYYNELFIKNGLAEDTGKIKFDDKNYILLPKALYKKISDLKNYHIYNQFIIRAQNRDGLKKFLTENEIGNEIYYPVPFHLQECFANLNHKKGDFPESEKASNTSLAIPIYPELLKEQQEYVVQKIKEFVQSK
ncbi:MAG: transcriptional regulator, partial [Ignavibacteriales bacterium]